MARLSYEQLEKLKEKFGVDRIWSFSKVDSFDTCTWLYKLKYVDKIKTKSDSCYTWWGTVSHELIQDFYDGKYHYEKMSELLEDKITEYNTLVLTEPKLKFPEDSIYENYIESLKHYFSNVKPLSNYEIKNEKPVLALFEGENGKYLFQGYIDSTYVDENGNTVILDYKTSSISGFSGKKLIDKSRQLMIYAMGLNQFQKIPLNKIKIRYDMMKYVVVSYPLKNGNIRETKAERKGWVGQISNQLRKDLEDVPKNLEKVEKEIAKIKKKLDSKKQPSEHERKELEDKLNKLEYLKVELASYCYDVLELNEMVSKAIHNNTLEEMPPFIQNKYTLSECYIDVELTPEIIEEFKKELINKLDKIIAKENEDDKDKAFERPRIEQHESFYCNTLCDMKEHCKIYEEYKEHMSMFLDKPKEESVSDDDILKMLGL